MSIALMTAAWRVTGLSSTQKLVLLSLADNANDQGECYPSIAQISTRTCLSDRAVRSTIRSLEEIGIVRSVARSGTSTVYFLSIRDPEPPFQPRHVVPPAPEPDSAPEGRSPRKDVPPTPERGSPPPRKDVPPTPERGSPKPSLNRQLNRQGTVNRPECVPEGVWSDFLAIRKAKRAPLTATALQGLEREAAKAGWPLERAIAKCCERGWQGFEAAWLNREERQTGPPARRESTEEHNRRAFAEWLGEPTPDDGRTIDA